MHHACTLYPGWGTNGLLRQAVGGDPRKATGVEPLGQAVVNHIPGRDGPRQGLGPRRSPQDLKGLGHRNLIRAIGQLLKALQDIGWSIHVSVKDKERNKMTDSNYGTPSEDARAMLRGLRKSSGMDTNCALQNIEVDPSTLRTVWITSLCTTGLIIAVHLTRWLTAQKNNQMELLVCLIGVAGALAFIHDVYQCNVHQGMCKLIMFLVVANCIIPRLLRYPEVPTFNDDGDDEGDIE